MIQAMKRNRMLWYLYRLLSADYQPPYGSVGHAIQSGKITKEYAREGLDR